MRGLKDIHAHIIYGVDDGPQTADEMYAMLDMAFANRVSAIYCTSHSTPGVERFPRELYDRHLQEARNYCRERRYPIRLFAGSEVLYTPALRNQIESGFLPTLADTSCVLVEFAPRAALHEVESAIQLLNKHGYLPVLAHIERYRCMYGLGAWHLKQKYNVCYQINCSTVLGETSRARSVVVRTWLRFELIDYVSSDAHNTTTRPMRMLESWKRLKEICSMDYLKRLMADEGVGCM